MEPGLSDRSSSEDSSPLESTPGLEGVVGGTAGYGWDTLRRCAHSRYEVWSFGNNRTKQGRLEALRLSMRYKKIQQISELE